MMQRHSLPYGPTGHPVGYYPARASQSVAPSPVSIMWLLTKNVVFSGLGPDLPFSETLGSGGSGSGEREKGEGSW